MDFLLSMVKKKLVGEQALYNVGHDPVYHYYLVDRCRLLPCVNPSASLHTIKPTFRGRKPLGVEVFSLAQSKSLRH